MMKVTAGIIIRDNQVLIMRRAPGEKHEGKWEFPGGKIEEGETPEICLTRELKEELNLEVEVKQFICVSSYNYSKDCIQLLAYLVEIKEGVIQLLVHDQLEWVNKDDLLNFELLPADIPIAMKVIEGLL